MSHSLKIAELATEAFRSGVPSQVRERARHLILDSVGVGLAAHNEDFVEKTISGLAELHIGDVPIIGRPETLSATGTAIVNGLIVHGFDYDDTHIPAVTHVSASALPAVLAALEFNPETTWDEMVDAFALSIEVSSRLGILAQGEFHTKGFHPTGVVGAFGSVVGIGLLRGENSETIDRAQGIVGSFASGLMQFLDEGSWTKRLHPGWAAQSGLSAVSLARTGFDAPSSIYEGRFGLYATHIGARTDEAYGNLGTIGQEWEVENVSVKPYPACHFTHSFIDVALRIVTDNSVQPDNIDTIEAWIHPTPGAVVAEPAEAKKRPVSEYDAKFSLPYLVAVAIVEGRVTQSELGPALRSDRRILELCDRVTVHDADDSLYPKAFSGRLRIATRDGAVFESEDQINRGHPDRPLTNDEISEKFLSNVAPVIGEAAAESIQSAIVSTSGTTAARSVVDAFVGSH